LKVGSGFASSTDRLADRIVIRCDGEVVADHARSFGRKHTVYDPGFGVGVNR